MADFDLEKLERLREQARSGEVTDFPTANERINLEPNKEYQFTYRDGLPFHLVLTPGNSANEQFKLEVGRFEDLKLSGSRPDVDFVIADRELAELKRGLVGIKGLRDGETVVIGRDTLNERFNFPERVSRRHVEIRREKSGNDDLIFFKDLGSTNGTVVIVRAPIDTPIS